MDGGTKMLITVLIITLLITSFLIYKYRMLVLKNRKILLENEDLHNRYDFIDDLEKDYNQKLKEVATVEKRIADLQQQYGEKYQIYKNLLTQIDLYNDDLQINNYGLFAPKFDYQTTERYKEHLTQNYQKQKELIKNLKAVEFDTDWIVQGSKTKGKQMIEQQAKLALRAFNAQCDDVIKNVKWNNLKKVEDKINKIYADINKLCEPHEMRICEDFLNLKMDELQLVFGYELKKYEEKEEQRRIKEQMREEEKVKKEIERKEKELAEQERQERELQALLQEAYNQGKQEEATKYQEEIAQLNLTIENNKRAISNAQLTKWGRIYVISNIGSFGENVYKIGMTRRDDPMDRINELGDASVPFKFDVHAIIESDNAPELENKLHDIFKKNSVNRINYRKEFFKVPLEEIEKAVNETTGSDIIFTKVAEAREYRETLSIIESENHIKISEQITNKDMLPMEI